MAEDTTFRLAGAASLIADGQSYPLVGQFGYRASTVTRTTLPGMDGIHGYKEIPVAGAIFGEIRDAGNISLADINMMTNVTVVLQLANGKLIVGSNMWTVNDQEVKSDEATFEVRWESRSVTEN